MPRKLGLDKSAIIADRKAGMSMDDLAEKHGCKRSSIWKYVTGVAPMGLDAEVIPLPNGKCRHHGCAAKGQGEFHLCPHHDNPRFFPLDFLPASQRAAYEGLRDAGRTRKEAMTEIGRPDLVTAEISA